jgi:hypothetical protein
MKKLLIAATIACIAIAACKKDDSNGGSGNGKTRNDTLTTGKWRMTAVTGAGKNPLSGHDTMVDIFASFDTCAKDDYYIFLATGHVTNDQGTMKCDSTMPQQTDGGTWSLSAAKDTLIMLDGTLPGHFKILSFSNSAMQLRSDTTFSGFLPIQLVATFVHE